MMTLVLVGLGGFLGGYATKVWQESWSEWRCDFLVNYSGRNAPMGVRCKYRRGHLGPHYTHEEGWKPLHHPNELEGSE